MITEATSRLAGRLAGLQYSDRGRVHLKNIPEPIHILQVYSELDAPPTRRWVLMFFGKPARTLGWRLGFVVAAIAAVTAAGVVYLTAGDGAEPENASPPDDVDRGRHGRRSAARGGARPECGARRDRARGDLEGLQAADGARADMRSRRRSVSRHRDCRTAGRSPRTGAAPTSGRHTGPSSAATRTAPRQRSLQRLHLGRRAPVAPRPRQARRACALLLRRQRRGHRLDPRASAAS